MTLEELVGWLDSNAVSYEIDDAGKLTVKGDLRGYFRDWVGTCKYTSLPDELIHVDGSLWLERTSITSLGNLTSVGGNFFLDNTPLTSLGNLTSVGGWLSLWGTPITSLGNPTSVGKWFFLCGTSVTSLDDLPQVGEDLYLDRDQFQLLTREALQKVKGKIRYRSQVKNEWITLSPDELETIVAENEQRERLHNTRGSDVDWDLYDR